MSINKKEYPFTAERYKEWTSVLGSKSLAFNIYTFNKYKTVKTGSGEVETFVKRKMGITVSEWLLPRYCNPELVEHALASLEKNPENLELLKTLGDYTKNNRFERIGYRLGAALSIIFLFAALFILAASVLVSIMLFPYLICLTSPPNIILSILSLGPIFPISALIAVVCFCMLGTSDAAPIISHLGLQIGRWIASLVKDNNQPDNLQELDDKLNKLINEQAKTAVVKIYPSLQQFEESLEPPVSNITTEQTTASATRCPSLLFTNNNPEVTVQNTTAKMNDSSQQVPNRFSAK